MEGQTKPPPPKLSFILVTYASGAVLEDCLRSLQNFQDQEIQVLVVDNHPDSPDLKSLGPRFKGVRFINNPQNNGFGGGNNLGAASARGDLLFFLNPDTVLESFDKEGLLSHFESHPQGICGFPLYYPEGGYCKPVKFVPEVDFILPKALYKLYYRYFLGKNRRLPGLSYVSGAAFAISRDLFERAGGFDEDYFLFFEENDLRCRLKKAGVYTPWYLKEGFRIIHYEGKSYSRNAIRWYSQSLKKFAAKHRKPYLPPYKVFCVSLSRFLKRIRKGDVDNLTFLIGELKTPPSSEAI